MVTDPPAGIDPDTWESALTAMAVASWDTPPSLWRSERDAMLRAALAVVGGRELQGDAYQERRRIERAIAVLPNVRPVDSDRWNAYLIDDVWRAIRGEVPDV